ncbi:hypothetical protein NG752_00610 [Aliarcobacter cryaerophilus]|uniref:hypothetical protein n=1 Tax=Aliarcobacter cryaerophilus TaxID=28198 RepID=UPI003DA400DA
MKAIEKLKDYIEDENRLGDLNYAHYSNIIDYVNEAIDELEDLKNRSCNECKHYLSDNGNYPLEPCSECSRFYSDKFERLEK